MDENNNPIDLIQSKLLNIYNLEADNSQVISSISKNYKLKHNKTKFRAIIIQSLYESEISGKNPLDILRRNYKKKEIAQKNIDFMEFLVNNFVNEKQMINDKINSKLIKKNLDLFLIDKNIIQLALIESLFSKEVNKKIIINEAVELAKYFGQDSSPKFVNGVLSSLI